MGMRRLRSGICWPGLRLLRPERQAFTEMLKEFGGVGGWCRDGNVAAGVVRPFAAHAGASLGRGRCNGRMGGSLRRADIHERHDGEDSRRARLIQMDRIPACYK